MVKRIIAAAVFLAITSSTALASPITLDGETPPYPVWNHTLLPGESLSLSLPDNHTAQISGARIDGQWTAPEKPGYHQLIVTDASGASVQEVSVFVLEPSGGIDARGKLNGYKIGTYPADMPEGFIRFGKDDADIPLSPHFRLGQFLCKQQPEHFPKYLLVTKPNLARLEKLLRSLHGDALTTSDTFFVMSGFRTPHYNTAIGSSKFSRHMYGDASDIYLDTAPQDGVMDDVNRDGRITKADADFLFDYAAKLFEAARDVLPGGLGSYKANAYHGPFLHVDGRGRKARWGR